jgi:predicted small secreted protein
MMKKPLLFVLLAAMLLLSACGNAGAGGSASSAAGSAQSAPASSRSGKTVEPLPAQLDLHALQDCTFAASFASSDVGLDGDGMLCVTMTVYDYELFDLVDISQLARGDILDVDGKKLEVTSVDRSGADVTVNGGLEEGGCDLHTDEDGVYYEVIMDAGKNYKAIGQVTLPVDQDFVYTDDSDLENPGKTFYAGDFLTAMENGTDTFQANATTVCTAGGKIVELTRIYMP